jgi:hypothetical protein
MATENNTSLYYQNILNVPYATKIGLYVRKKIFNYFMEINAPLNSDLILDVGVTSEKTQDASNFFEKLYPFPYKITCVGTENGSYLEKEFPGLIYQQIFPNKQLPFDDNQFDFAFSNAVVEHTGSYDEQRFFIHEICRVSKNFFIVTPNRWYPVETHTGIPFLHFLPKTIFRKLLKNTKYDFWSSEKNLNLLSMDEFTGLFPENVVIKQKKIKLLGITTNLIVYGKKI